MFSHNSPNGDRVDSKTYPLGENVEQTNAINVSSIVALSHTPVEHRLYSAMLSVLNNSPTTNSFTVRNLMTLTGIGSLSTVRRGLEGLIVKHSIDRNGRHNGNKPQERGHAYRVYSPAEVITRRKEAGGTVMSPYDSVPDSTKRNPAFVNAITRVAKNALLSRREAQVGLCCVEGLTNAQIGHRLQISEQTVKFHLRHIFMKFGVKRRAELISRLLM